MTVTEKIANDPRVTVAARIAQFATPIIVLICLSVIGWIMMAQSQEKAQLENRVDNLETFAASANSRVSVLESNKINRDKQIADINARIDANQNTVETKLDKIVDAVSTISAELAAVNATLRATSRQP